LGTWGGWGEGGQWPTTKNKKVMNPSMYPFQDLSRGLFVVVVEWDYACGDVHRTNARSKRWHFKT